jgi:carbohydrate ABC transporter ATP-binding protein
MRTETLVSYCDFIRSQDIYWWTRHFLNINNKRDFIQEYFQLARERNINIVFVSQDLYDADFAERSYIMENGVLKMMS